MLSGVMVTDGGAHPPELWGLKTAERIFDTSKVASERVILAQKTQIAIAEILVAHHGHIQETERLKLKADPARLSFSEDEHAQEAMAEAEHIYGDIMKVIKDTPWAEKYASEDTKRAVLLTVASDLMTNKNIEKQYHEGG